MLLIDNSKNVKIRGNIFLDRHSCLLDEARLYRMKIAELSCIVDHQSRHMVQFYNSELSRMEEEI